LEIYATADPTVANTPANFNFEVVRRSLLRRGADEADADHRSCSWAECVRWARRVVWPLPPHSPGRHPRCLTWPTAYIKRPSYYRSSWLHISYLPHEPGDRKYTSTKELQFDSRTIGYTDAETRKSTYSEPIETVVGRVWKKKVPARVQVTGDAVDTGRVRAAALVSTSDPNDGRILCGWTRASFRGNVQYQTQSGDQYGLRSKCTAETLKGAASAAGVIEPLDLSLVPPCSSSQLSLALWPSCQRSPPPVPPLRPLAVEGTPTPPAWPEGCPSWRLRGCTTPLAPVRLLPAALALPTHAPPGPALARRSVFVPRHTLTSSG
jgi:hypothetical protein